jgi:ethanolamine ammonia-lyase small subunit
VEALVPQLDGLVVGPLVIAEQARVALGDGVGEALGARLVVLVIGERPGLSSPDSIGCYLTFDPRVGRHDAQRNCVSNIRPQGLAPAVAAVRVAWLVRAALARSLTGVGLKDDSTLIDLEDESKANASLR